MAENEGQPAAPGAPDAAPAEGSLEGGTYEIIRGRLVAHGAELRKRMEQLNEARKAVFGAIETTLRGSERLTTENNCVPRDIVQVGRHVLFGYNVFVGLRAETTLADVFSCYTWAEGTFTPEPLDLIADERFEADFRNLYKYYRGTRFAKFSILGPHLFMAFRVGKSVDDIKTFKWLIRGDRLDYVDNRSDHEFVLPPQHEFEWTRVTHDMHRSGSHPHISIADRLFVEAVGGDLTVKVEDNTETGEGIYSEPVDNPDQTLDDAEIYYAIVGNIILLKVRPFQEEAFRYLAYNEKVQQAVRIDALADACVLLPDDHGLIFPRGCYLQTGALKQFDLDMTDMVFTRRIAAPNGEDHLYVFYNRDTGVYVMMMYNLINQQVGTPIVCNGRCSFDDGTMICFRADDEPKKHHALQIWQTPFCGPDYVQPVQQDSYLYRLGNRDIVRCMAECSELLTLISKEETFANLYVDIAKKARAIRTSYFWIDSPETFGLDEPLDEIAAAAAAAIDEFEKVVRTRRATRREIDRVSARVREIIHSIDYFHLDDINEFVRLLGQLRAVRGEVVALRDLRYADLELAGRLEAEVAEHTDRLSDRCVEFLLTPESLAPYRQRIEGQAERIPQLAKVADAVELEGDVASAAGELEMLIDIVSNLKIADATQTTAIIDNISLVLSRLNQVRSALSNRKNELAAAEGQAEFAAQMKLIDQAVINYLDVCDTPERCDEYLTRLTSQMETLESRFADFDEFIGKLSEKREELYNAFESRKAQLVEQRNRRASALMTAAERILKGIRNRAAAFEDVNEISGYFASDLMIERVRETIGRLRDLGDAVKAEDVAGRLKTIQQEAVRQLKDRQGLFEDGLNVVRFGEHRFSVNRQPLELTVVRRDGGMFFHLTGTGFFWPITDEALLATRDVWDLEVPSESPSVYRAEYLAYRMLCERAGDGAVAETTEAPFEEVLAGVQAYMAPRYAEGYVKGVHDHDAATILKALAGLKTSIGLLRYPSTTRALATVFWRLYDQPDRKALFAARMAGLGSKRELFAAAVGEGGDFQAELAGEIAGFVERTGLFDAGLVEPAAEYLAAELAGGKPFVTSKSAADLRDAFRSHLRSRRFEKRFTESCDALAADPAGRYRLIREWVRAYLAEAVGPDTGGQAARGTRPQLPASCHGWLAQPCLAREIADEVAALLLDGDAERTVLDVALGAELTGMTGSHPCLADGRYQLDYCRFMTRLAAHEREVVPRFQAYQRLKKTLIDRFAAELRLDQFEAPVLSTFVRNRLIDKVYLPLVGDSLARQIGTTGQQKRTDRQGLLLLISPPGYGKTTLMAYIANRLGLIFVKVNGPAIGHRVTSLDPAEAPNAAAREEIEKLNLAFEMGDNVMIYLDDIQHCNAELLQKFISLCDAQRRVEGVYGGRTRTYDLRGKRVCVVMAGNPYTESGEKFRIPDMLANRADTYNIGDIVGDNYYEFVGSFVENCLTSNPVLGTLAVRSQADVYAVMKLAEGAEPDSVEFEGNYAVDELDEYVATMRKLFTVRDVVLRVNQQYIRSAAQADEYRTEPPFLLQGSYRNMNRIASRVLPVMNDQELWTLIYSNYEQDAQTLTTGTEANLLKFKELTGRLGEAEAARWEQIKKTFGRNKLLGGPTDDKVGMVIRQLSAFGAGLESIKDVLSDGIAAVASARPAAAAETRRPPELPAALTERLGQVAGSLDAIQTALSQGVAAMAKPAPPPAQAIGEDVREAAAAVMDKMNEIIAALSRHQAAMANAETAETATRTEQDARTLVSVLEEQFATMQTWLTPVLKTAEGRQEYIGDLLDRFRIMVDGYNRLIGVLEEKYHLDEPTSEAEASPTEPADQQPAPRRKTPRRRGG